MIGIHSKSKYDALEVGDLVSTTGNFSQSGVVVEKKADNQIVISSDPKDVSKYHRYSTTTGLTLEEKEKFNSIMDEISKTPNLIDEISLIQIKINELKNKEDSGKVTSVLQNKQAELIRKSQELPMVYEVGVEQVQS